MSRTTQTSQVSAVDVEALVFGTLPEQGMETMTEGGVEFILCASALTAQM